MKILIVDTETGGLDPKNDPCIEVGAILYDLALATPVWSFSSLIRGESNNAQAINRIPVEALASATMPRIVWETVGAMAADADAFLAHRAEFDHGFFPADVAAIRPWVCSKFDLTWPMQNRPGEGLVELALNHGLGVGYAHRALADCELLSRLLTRCHETGLDIVKFVKDGMLPRIVVQALVSYDDREKAKTAGFSWDGASKKWTKRVIAGAYEFPFKTQEVA